VFTIGAPSLLKCVLGPYLVKLERKQGKNNIENAGCGHYETDLGAFAKEFAAARTGRFVGGAAPGHPDVSLYGFLAGFLACGAPIAQKFVDAGDLGDWLAGMQEHIPLALCFQKPGKEGYTAE
jgi:hypothetical protein